MGNRCIVAQNLNVNSLIACGQAKLRSITLVRRIKKSKISTVWLAKSIKLKTFFALKVTKKLQSRQKNSTHGSINEQSILRKISHPIIANFIDSFQDLSHLYIAIQYMPYGSLRDYMNLSDGLTQSQIRFVLICLLLSVEYLHKKQIAHLDIKPENLLIDQFGYFRLCDFNLSADLKNINKKTKLKGVGTSGYQAPQVLQNQILIGLESDLYSIGVMCVQMATGFKTRSNQVFLNYQLKQMLKNRANLSNNCLNFIQRLLQQNPVERLGANGNFNQIWNHQWLKIYPTQKQEYLQKLIPSFVHDQYRKTYKQFIKQNEQSVIQSQDQQQDSFIIKAFLENKQFQNQFTKFAIS